MGNFGGCNLFNHSWNIQVYYQKLNEIGPLNQHIFGSVISLSFFFIYIYIYLHTFGHPKAWKNEGFNP